MTEKRYLIDNTFISNLYLSDAPADAVRMSRMLTDLSQSNRFIFTDMLVAEASSGNKQGNIVYKKDDTFTNLLSDINVDFVGTKTMALRVNSIDSNATNIKDPNFFPRNNAGERALIEVWQPGDVIVSDDRFFDKVQHTDVFTKAVRPDFDSDMLKQIQGTKLTTAGMLNQAVVDGVISLDDHQAVAQRHGPSDYLTPDEVAHRKTLLADGHDPKVVHSLPLESHASRAVGAVSLGVDLAQGNYGAAAVDAASMAVESKAVQEAALEGAAKVGLKETFNLIAKRAPLIGAAVTLVFVAKEAGAHVMDGEYKLAGAATVAGVAEAGGNLFGFGVGDVAREATRGAFIAVGGDEFAAIEKSDIRQLSGAAYDVGKQLLASPPAQEPPEGRVLTDILPADIRSMTQGADEMGDRSEIRHVAVERTGLAANDPRNDLGAINQNPEGPKAHLLILADGRVQGPDEGGVPFDRNPSIAAGKNGETIGVMYAGQGAMNDAQWSTVRQISDYVEQQRRLEGRGGTPELMAGTTATADMLGLPTPRGSQMAQATQTRTMQQRQAMGRFSA